MGAGDGVGLWAFSGNAGSIAPGKAPQSLCSCLRSGVAPGNGCCVSVEIGGLWESHEDLARPLSEVSARHRERQPVRSGFLQTRQQWEQSKKKARMDQCLLSDCFRMDGCILMDEMVGEWVDT